MSTVAERQFVSSLKPRVIDPIRFVELHWPDIYLYDKQREIMYSVMHNDETVVPAGNMLGKDFVAGLIVLWFFLSRSPCRILTTSVDGTQLQSILWGEIRRFIQTSKFPLRVEQGGPLIVNHLHLRKMVKGRECGRSEVIGRVASQGGEGMLGAHLERIGGLPCTMFIADEASGVPDVYWEKADTWAHVKLAVGNCFPCENFFKFAIKGKPGTNDHGGDIPRPSGKGFYRKVIHIKATDSPNIQLGLEEIRRGMKPSGRVLVQGVKDWETYQKNLQLWDAKKQCVSLDAEFYEGAEIFMFPREWLDRSAKYAEVLAQAGSKTRKAECIGIDPAEGGDSTVWTIVDRRGVLAQISKKTPDTSLITKDTLALMREHGLKAEQVMFDQGGGGKEHADRLRSMGYNVRTVAFGEVPESVDKWKYSFNYRPMSEHIDDAETKYAYRNRRNEMYDLLRTLLNPINSGFGIPNHLAELRRQLAVIPLDYDEEGRLSIPPKHRKPGQKETERKTLSELVGHSPDEADSLVLAVFGMLNRPTITKAGVAW